MPHSLFPLTPSDLSGQICLLPHPLTCLPALLLEDFYLLLLGF